MSFWDMECSRGRGSWGLGCRSSGFLVRHSLFILFDCVSRRLLGVGLLRGEIAGASGFRGVMSGVEIFFFCGCGFEGSC